MNDKSDRKRWFLGTTMNILVAANDTDGALTVIEQEAPRGFSPPLHVHNAELSVMYVLEGQVTVKLGDSERVLVAGEAATLPPKIPHTFRVDSARARLLELSTPGGVEGYFVELSDPAGDADTAPFVEPDPQALAARAPAYDLEILGPPMIQNG